MLRYLLAFAVLLLGVADASAQFGSLWCSIRVRNTGPYTLPGVSGSMVLKGTTYNFVKGSLANGGDYWVLDFQAGYADKITSDPITFNWSIHGLPVQTVSATLTSFYSGGWKYNMTFDVPGAPAPPSGVLYCSTFGRNLTPDEYSYQLVPSATVSDLTVPNTAGFYRYNVKYYDSSARPLNPAGPYGSYEFGTPEAGNANALNVGTVSGQPPAQWNWKGVTFSDVGMSGAGVPTGYQTGYNPEPNPWLGSTDADLARQQASLQVAYGESLNGRIGELASAIASMPAPVVNVAAPVVNVAAPVVNVPAPVVSVTVEGGGGVSGDLTGSVGAGLGSLGAPDAWTDTGLDFGAQDDTTEGGASWGALASAFALEGAGDGIAATMGALQSAGSGIWQSGIPLGRLGAESWRFPTSVPGLSGGGTPAPAAPAPAADPACPASGFDRFLLRLQATLAAFTGFFTVGTLDRSLTLVLDDGAASAALSGLRIDASGWSAWADAMRACLIIYLSFHMFESCRMMLSSVFGSAITR